MTVEVDLTLSIRNHSNWSAEKTLDGQRHRGDIPAHARIACNGLAQTKTGRGSLLDRPTCSPRRPYRPGDWTEQRILPTFARPESALHEFQMNHSGARWESTALYGGVQALCIPYTLVLPEPDGVPFCPVLPLRSNRSSRLLNVTGVRVFHYDTGISRMMYFLCVAVKRYPHILRISLWCLCFLPEYLCNVSETVKGNTSVSFSRPTFSHVSLMRPPPPSIC